jgi:hypothetical protein
MENEKQEEGAPPGDLIRKLPWHEAPPHLWERIEGRLFLQEALGNRMPVYPCPEEVWENISARLDAEESGARTRRLYVLTGIAASLLLVAVFFMKTVDNGHEVEAPVITYEERVLVDNPTVAMDISTKEALDVLHEYCARQSALCEQEDFRQLVHELNTLTDEIRHLEKLYPAYLRSQENPELVKMKLKIENTHAEVLKTLMNLIQS